MDNKNNMFPLMLLLMVRVVLVAAQSQDFTALRGLMENWGNTPTNWVGADPCGNGWDGIGCNNSRVISITLASMNLTGSLSSEIQLLSELQTLALSSNKGLTGTIPLTIGNLAKLQILILVDCDFFGTIPDTIGSLRQLTFLALNDNRFGGKIPRTIGNLSNLNWLDLSNNQLEGSIPVSDSEGPGLDMMLKTEHFHFGNNRLSGEIPTKLFRENLSLIHVLFNDNQLNGSIPRTLMLVRSLEVVRFDRNQLTGPVPANINTLTNLSKLFLSNNNLNGSLPDLTGLNLLANVDLSNNSFSSSDIPSWASSLPSLTTLKLESTGLQGLIPVSLFNQSNLESVDLRGNDLKGPLDIGSAYSKRLQVIDLVNNSITGFKQRNIEKSVTVILFNNPVCLEEAASTPSYCKDLRTNRSYSSPSNNCSSPLCNANQISSPNCKCAFPYIGNLSSRAIGISNYENATYYLDIHNTLMTTFQSLNLPVDSVSLSDPLQTSIDNFQLSLKIFPSQGDRFNITGVSSIALVFINQIYIAPGFFNPYHFSGEDYKYYAAESTRPKLLTGVIVGAVVGVFAFMVISILLGIYAFRQKKRAERAIEMNPFVNWALNEDTGAAPQLKGARWFSFEELRRYSNNFSQSNVIGSGGYGAVYLATLPTRELVAIKRAKRESIQGAAEFKTEIELLSRVHHKNLVGLVGFCYEKGEQMLVYEYIPNGTLADSLSGKSGIRVDWMRRLKVALGAAKGLAYLHELASPPIIHRDIKTSNILLDERLNAKVADFGLSKLVDDGRGHITTQVKGTMGYLDPEYYMTQLLTEKSDVYSFGVVMLELVTARRPIEQGKYIVRAVQNLMNSPKYPYNIMSIIDPIIIKVTTPKGLQKFVNLALRCVKEFGADRPTMVEVVKEIENIMELAGLNPAAESTTTSKSYEEMSGHKVCHPYKNEDFYYSGDFSSTKVEPQ